MLIFFSRKSWLVNCSLLLGNHDSYDFQNCTCFLFLFPSSQSCLHCSILQRSSIEGFSILVQKESQKKAWEMINIHLGILLIYHPFFGICYCFCIHVRAFEKSNDMVFCDKFKHWFLNFLIESTFLGSSKAIPQSYYWIILLLYTRYEGALDPWLLILWKSLNQTNSSLLPRISDAIHPNLNILGDAKVEVIYYSAPQDTTISGGRSQFCYFLPVICKVPCNISF